MTIARFIAKLWNGGDRREHPRRRKPAMTLLIGQHSIETVEWSLGGCRVAVDAIGKGPVRPGDRLAGQLHVARAPEGRFIAEVMRVGPEGEVGMRWIEITGSTFATMLTTYS